MAIKFFPVAGALAALSLVPFVLEAPAQAAVCPTGTSSTLFPGTGVAATYATVFSGSYSCTIGDMVFSNFASPTADLAALATKPYFWFTEDLGAMAYSISYGFNSAGAGVGTFPAGVAGAPAVKTYGFSYKATIDQAIAPGYGFSGYDVGRTGTTPSATTPAGNPNFQQTLTGTTVNFYTMNFTTSARLAGTASNTRILYNEFSQETVPGPLPLVGAGVAFGFSRKIRRRALKAA